ncbi:MAG: ZIP family metal transporter [Candidatus Hodarchaeota archaeon]
MVGADILILFYSTLAGTATLLGILLMEKKQQWALDYSHYVNSFAAGLIIAVAFFHLIPEAYEFIIENSKESDLFPETGLIPFVAVFLGFLGFFMLENIVVLHSGAEIHYCIDEEGPHSPHVERLGVMAFSGLVFHSLIDGVIIGVGFEVSEEVGIFAALAVILHEVPEGITSFAIMRRSMDLKKARYFAVIVALATPIGAIFSLLVVGSLDEATIGLMLAIAAGTFIYVSAADLIPETHESNNLKNLIAFLIGAVFIYILTLTFAE